MQTSITDTIKTTSIQSIQKSKKNNEINAHTIQKIETSMQHQPHQYKIKTLTYTINTKSMNQRNKCNNIKSTNPYENITHIYRNQHHRNTKNQYNN